MSSPLESKSTSRADALLVLTRFLKDECDLRGNVMKLYFDHCVGNNFLESLLTNDLPSQTEHIASFVKSLSFGHTLLYFWFLPLISQKLKERSATSSDVTSAGNYIPSNFANEVEQFRLTFLPILKRNCSNYGYAMERYYSKFNAVIVQYATTQDDDLLDNLLYELSSELSFFRWVQFMWTYKSCVADTLNEFAKTRVHS
jgi:hypothetical protein